MIDNDIQQIIGINGQRPLHINRRGLLKWAASKKPLPRARTTNACQNVFPDEFVTDMVGSPLAKSNSTK
jgi:hypothetical protein